MKRKGSAYIGLVAMCLIFFGMLFYSLFTQVNGLVYEETYAMINETNNTFTTSAKDTMEDLASVWGGFILLFVFGILSWGFMAASRKEPNYG